MTELNSKLQIGEWLNDFNYKRLIKIIFQFQEIFVSGKNLNVTNRLKFVIHLKNEYPFYHKSQLSNVENNLLIMIVNELISSGHLKKSNSPYSSFVKPVFREEDGRLQLFVDYDYLNELTLITNYHTSTIFEIINSIPNSAIFSKIVIKDAFYQLELDQLSQSKTAFATDFGHFEFVTYNPFLKNAKIDLQYLMDRVLDEINFAKAYQDQILVFTNNLKDHFDTLTLIFNRLKNWNLKVDINESRFVDRRVNYLGYQLSKNGISIDDENLVKINEFQEPNSKEEIRSFLDLISQFQRFIDDFDRISRSLYAVINQSSFFYWGGLEKNSFFFFKE